MAQPGGSSRIRSDADKAASESVTRLAAARRAENRAASVVVHEVHELSEIRLAAEMDVHLLGADHGDMEPNVGRAQHSTECDAAVALSLSRTMTREMITVANQLAWRLPTVDAAFTVGDLDYSRVRTIALTLVRASDCTVSALEADVLATALRCNVKALRENIWRLWISHNPEEAAAAQSRAVSEERCADIRRGNDGIATLVSKMTMLEGAECDAILDELARTVCSNDPRTKKQLRGYALLALCHREESLVCQCKTEFCPVATAAQFVAPRRAPLVNIHIDLDTLLGLNENPATLADGTVLDPELVRLLATDARWRALLSDMWDAAQAYRKENYDEQADSAAADSSDSSDSGVPEHTRGTADSDDKAVSKGSPGADRSDGSDGGGVPRRGRPRTDRAGTNPRAKRLIARGRSRPPAPLPPTARRSARTSTPTSSAPLGQEVELSAAIAEFLAAAAADPTLTEGIHPDGHGGHNTPPPGALTYRPTATLVALVRATYSTCTFPGCSVPAARCDIDHIVPFDHNDPPAGGWTILENLHPLCPYHHHAKTLRLWACAKLDGNGIYWRSGAGTHRITPPEYGTVTVPENFLHRTRFRRTTPDRADGAGTVHESTGYEEQPDDTLTPDSATSPSAEPPEELYEPTWWETHISDQDNNWGNLLDIRTDGDAPTLGDIARLTDPQARADAIYLRTKFIEHRTIVTEREKHRPPPF
ncbi:HNH endonuclease signature motif containing protein [Rhodococcus sovatensis]|uniref:DUF222 domain-containing protein n=1 Tax=Rhodococcus sovatensis TaxID=1805840 RepID=A0ABZ2PH17_9NOCA